MARRGFLVTLAVSATLAIVVTAIHEFHQLNKVGAPVNAGSSMVSRVAYVTRDGAKAQVRLNGEVTDANFNYGQQFSAECPTSTLKGCILRSREGGAIEIARDDISYRTLPVRTQYAIRKTAIFKDRLGTGRRAWLREGQQVELTEYDTRLTSDYAKIKSPQGYVNIRDLQDHTVTLEEKKAETARAAAERRAQEGEREAKILARRTFAALLRDRYLDQGFDIKVSASGRAADRLTLQFVLFNDVWSHKMRNGPLITEIQGLGFRRLDMKNGYDWHVYWNFD